MTWEEEYKSKIVSAEEAISHIKSGDRVVFVQGNEPQALGLALAARFGELENVSISVRTPGRDFGWYDPGWEASFAIEIGFPLPIVRQMIAEKKMRYRHRFVWASTITSRGLARPTSCCWSYHHRMPTVTAVLELRVWTKLSELRGAKLVMAEVNKNLIRTYGENSRPYFRDRLLRGTYPVRPDSGRHRPFGKKERRTRTGREDYCRVRGHTDQGWRYSSRSEWALPASGAPAWTPLRVSMTWAGIPRPLRGASSS